MAEEPKERRDKGAGEAPAAQADEPVKEAAQPEQKQEAPAPTRTAPPLPEGVHYVWGTGRRKKSVARVRIRPGTGKFLVNKREVNEYFKGERDRQAAVMPLEVIKMARSWDVWVNVSGGGQTGQAGAVKLGLARALAKVMPEEEGALRDNRLMTRDARMKERKKYGQPGARKRFQYSKR